MVVILLTAVLIFCVYKILRSIFTVIKNGNFSKAVEKRLIFYSTILLVVYLLGTLYTSSKTQSVDATYLFTTDEHYFEYEITEIKEVPQNILSNETSTEYIAKSGETIIVEDTSLKILDEGKNLLYQNSGSKVIVTIETE